MIAGVHAGTRKRRKDGGKTKEIEGKLKGTILRCATKTGKSFLIVTDWHSLHYHYSSASKKPLKCLQLHYQELCYYVLYEAIARPLPTKPKSEFFNSLNELPSYLDAK